MLFIFIRIYYSKSSGCVLGGLLSKYFVMALLARLSRYTIVTSSKVNFPISLLAIEPHLSSDKSAELLTRIKLQTKKKTPDLKV